MSVAGCVRLAARAPGLRLAHAGSWHRADGEFSLNGPNSATENWASPGENWFTASRRHRLPRVFATLYHTTRASSTTAARQKSTSASTKRAGRRFTSRSNLAAAPRAAIATRQQPPSQPAIGKGRLLAPRPSRGAFCRVHTRADSSCRARLWLTLPVRVRIARSALRPGARPVFTSPVPTARVARHAEHQGSSSAGLVALLGVGLCPGAQTECTLTRQPCGRNCPPGTAPGEKPA